MCSCKSHYVNSWFIVLIINSGVICFLTVIQYECFNLMVRFYKLLGSGSKIKKIFSLFQFLITIFKIYVLFVF